MKMYKKFCTCIILSKYILKLCEIFTKKKKKNNILNETIKLVY